MKKRVLISVILILLVTVILAGLYIKQSFNSDKNVTATVQTLEDSVTTKGYIVKNEAVVDLNGGEFVRYYCDEGDKVAYNTHIATVYNDEADGKILYEIERLEEKIKKMEEDYAGLTSNNLVKIENLIEEDSNEYFSAISKGNIYDAAIIKEGITSLFDMKHLGIDANSDETGALKNAKSELESRLSSGKSTVKAPMGGIFVGDTDGFEGLINFEKANNITVRELQDIMNKEPGDTNKKCKVVDNYKWLLMCVVPAENVVKTNIGDSIEIVTDSGETIEGSVEYISSPENGECVITISSNKDFFGIERERLVNITVVFNKYTGYVVPSEAIHMYNGNYGVFVEIGNKLRFKKAEFIYSGDEYTVIDKEKTELKLYDNVVVEGDFSEFYN